MMQTAKRMLGYCPHPPLEGSPEQGVFYSQTHWLRTEVWDFASSIDGLVGFAILYGLLFLVSLIALPVVGTAAEYQLILLRVAFTIALTNGILYLYTKSRSTTLINIGRSRLTLSLTESLIAIIIWAGLLLFFGTISGSYNLVGITSGHLPALPSSLLVGLLGGLTVYGYSAPKFEKGLGTLLAIILSSTLGVLLYFAVSFDYPFIFVPITVLMVYVSLQTGSAVGPIVATTLLFGFLSLWTFFQFSTGFLQPTYGSIIAAVISGLFVALIHPRLAGMTQ
jgi:hypothetical protein